LQSVFVPSFNDHVGELVTHSLSVHDLLISSERYGLVSFAPADYIEHRGLSSTRPPAPLEQQMSISLLQLNVDDLLEWVKRKESEENKLLTAAIEGTEHLESTSAFDDDFFPSAASTAQNSTSASLQSLPTFQQLAAAAPTSHPISASTTTFQSTLPTQFLDLELNAQSDSDEDDDSDEM
jgi:hypothetical protein